MKAGAPGPTFELLGTPYLRSHADDAVAWMLSGPRGTLHAANVHTAVLAWFDPELAAARAGALALLPDGKPLMWAARLLGVRGAHTLRGPGIFGLACDRGRQTGARHYFYGGEPGVADKVAKNLKLRFKGMRVVGAESPPFREATDAELKLLIAKLRRQRCDLLWVALGAPKQEKLMERLRKLGAPCLVVGVGAAFEIWAGRMKEAPAIVSGVGLEWAWRLAQDPKRLWKRYLSTNPLFVLGAALDFCGLWHGHAVEGFFRVALMVLVGFALLRGSTVFGGLGIVCLLIASQLRDRRGKAPN